MPPRTKPNRCRQYFRIHRPRGAVNRKESQSLTASALAHPPIAVAGASLEIVVAEVALVGGRPGWLYCSWSLLVDGAPAPVGLYRNCGPALLDLSRTRAWFDRQLPHYLCGKVDADDLLQDAFLRAWRQSWQFIGDSAEQYSQWLMSICRTCLTAQIAQYTTPGRDARRESRLEDDAPVSGDQRPNRGRPGHAADGIEAVDWADELAVLLAGFSARTRQVVVWHALESRTLPEIATELGCSVRTVERDWRHAREVLRRRVLARKT